MLNMIELSRMTVLYTEFSKDKRILSQYFLQIT